MFAYLVRHAIAAPRDGIGVVDDAARALTPKGMRRMRQVVRGLVRLDAVFEEIWTSPLVRARQTADILAESPSFEGNLRVMEALRPGGNLNDIAQELAGRCSLTGVALVGHEPDLGELAGMLLAGSPQGLVTLRKGGVACLEIKEGAAPLRGRLNWLMTPGQLRGIRS